MLAIDLAKEIAALGGYTITGSSGQDPSNKTRAFRRLNSIKADIISRFGGRWPAQYKEGWLTLQPIYNTGTITVTQGSTDVTGVGTSWLWPTNSIPVVMVGAKILMPDGSYYKIAQVISATELTLTTSYAGPSTSGATYSVWRDEYKVFPDVHSIGGFLDYQFQGLMTETWPRNMKDSYPYPVNTEIPTVYTVIGRAPQSDTQFFTVTGTLSGTINTNVLNGSNITYGFLGSGFGGGTNGLSPMLEPGMVVTLNGDSYTIQSVTSNTQLTLYQQLTKTYTNASYSITGYNPLIVRFREPTSQRVVHYWYWSKSANLINDNDTDWVCEMYPEVILLGASYKDYLDKNDVGRAGFSKQNYENAIKDMKVAEDNAMTGVRTLGYFLPPEARD